MLERKRERKRERERKKKKKKEEEKIWSFEFVSGFRNTLKNFPEGRKSAWYPSI